MITVDVQAAFNDAIELLGYPVAWPNVGLKPTTLHLRVNYLESRSEEHSFGTDRMPFIVQVDVVDKNGKGAIIAATAADVIRNRFKKGTQLTSGTTTIKVDQQPWSGSHQNDSLNGSATGWFFIPISIPFEVFL